MSENCLCRAECSTLGEARSNFGGVVGYVPKIATRHTAKWDVQNGAMSFQTRPSCMSCKGVRKITYRSQSYMNLSGEHVMKHFNGTGASFL
ncbi:DUF6783 domain-containing protein [Lachnospiraceae bacterium 54-53]